MSNFPTFPVASNGLEGWTSCCDAAVTFTGDGALVCKGCYHEAAGVPVGGEAGDALGEIIHAVLMGDVPCADGVARQRALLGEVPADATGYVHSGVTVRLPR